MTIPKDIPEKWFPIILPLKRKKEGLTNTTKIRNGAGTFPLRCHFFTTDLRLVVVVVFYYYSKYITLYS